MSSLMDALFAEIGAPALFELMGDTCVYTTAAGVATTLTAVIGPEQTEEVVDADGVTRRRARDCLMPRTAAAAGGGSYVAAPSLEATVTIGGEVWAVQRLLSQTEDWTSLRLTRPESAERSRRGYRTV